MNISTKKTGDINLIISIDFTKEDYVEEIEKKLKEHRRKADVPGFRKGHIPMGMIRQKYESSLKLERLNTLSLEALQKYISDEKISLLGRPIPIAQDNFDITQDNFSFSYEIGIQPQIDINLNAKKNILKYEIEISDDFLEEEIRNRRIQYGELLPKDKVSDLEKDMVYITIENKEKNIKRFTDMYISDIEDKAIQKKFVGKKADDMFQVNSKKLFPYTMEMAEYLNIKKEEAIDFDEPLNIRIHEVNTKELAEMNQEFFDKAWEGKQVHSKDELKEKLKDFYQRTYDKYSDQAFMNDVTQTLINETKFELPKDFLKKSMIYNSENEISQEEVETEYQQNERKFRYQIIENKIKENYNIKVDPNDIREATKEYIKEQMILHDIKDIKDEELENFSMRILSDSKEIKRFSDKVMDNKFLKLYKENINMKSKKISPRDFEKEMKKIKR